MSGWEKFFFILIALGLIWLLLAQIKNNPKAFSRKKFSQSLWTLGWLALFLIGVIAILVVWIRH